MQRTALISGAGIAGCTLAYWLARRGFRVTVVEPSGRPTVERRAVDVHGSAVVNADPMEISRQLRQAQTDVAGMRFVTTRGTPVARVSLAALRRGGVREATRHWRAAKRIPSIGVAACLTTPHDRGCTGFSVSHPRL